MQTFDSGLSLLVVLVRLGLGTVVFLKVVRLAWFSLWPCTFLSVGHWNLSLASGFSCMLTT